MTEAVDEVQNVTGSTRVRVALISGAVSVVLALVGVVPRLIGGEALPTDPPVMATAKASPLQAEKSSPQLWRIEGKVEPPTARVALRLVPWGCVEEREADSLGEFKFGDLAEGDYQLFVVDLDGDRDIFVSLDTYRKEPKDGPAPLNFVTITQQRGEGR